MIDLALTPLEILFWEALVLIVAACFFAPLFKRFGLGTVLGYLAAGLAVQVTLSLSFSDHPEELLHFAEFGVVLFLFVIGLELKPSELWQMRGDILGLGLTQMLVCGAALASIGLASGMPIRVAIIVGFGFALSSTALVMQSLEETGQRASPHGRKAFSILLFQDLAIVPLLLLVALLAPTGEDMTLMDGAGQAGIAIAAITILVLAGRFLLNPMFHLLAQSRMTEIMTAAALGVVLLAGLLMDLAGMSYAMGAFIAGVMLAESRFRHEVEANVEPFRGLFMGLFFMAVGLSLDLQVLAANWFAILWGAPALMMVKSTIVYGLLITQGNPHTVAVRTALALPQAGEFGFVLFSAAATAGLLEGDLSAILVAIVILSMALSPLVARLERFALPNRPPDEIDETFEDATGSVLIIGFGRFGQIVSQPLFSKGMDVTILDRDTQRVRDAEGFGFRIHFGDGTRRDVLRAAGIGRMRLVIVAVNDAETANTVLERVRMEAPQAKVFVRSMDRAHSIHLRHNAVDFEVRETLESALRMGKYALVALGCDRAEAIDTLADIRKRDRDRLNLQVEGDLHSGLDRLHRTAVKPEPLRAPEGQDDPEEAPVPSEAKTD